jgi:hypothetical protein
MISSLRSLVTFITGCTAVLPLVATSQPSVTDTNDAQGGRYRLVAISQGTDSTPYVIDTHTGRIWRQVVDSDKKSLVFVSMEYQNVKGELSKVPNEVATTVAARTGNTEHPQPLPDSRMNELLTTAPTISFNTNLPAVEQSGITRLRQLTNEVVAATKEVEYWRVALELCKQGKPCKMLKGFSPVTGEPMYGEELQPTDALKDGLKEAIDNCLKVKSQKEQEIRRLMTTLPEK